MELELKRQETIQKISYLEFCISNAKSHSEKDYYQQQYNRHLLLLKQTDDLMRQNQMKLIELTKAELAQYNGENGQKAYVAVNGIIYDITENRTWSRGSHFGLKAGRDLTNDFINCHNQAVLLQNLSKVGVLKDE